MRLYLDYERPAPEGWRLVRWPDEAIELLRSGAATHISLDHDLGDDSRGTGYDVILWIEQAVVTQKFKPPATTVHSAHPAARTRMNAGVRTIKRLAESE